MSRLHFAEIFSLFRFQDLDSAVIVKADSKTVKNLFQTLVLIYQLTILKKGDKTALAYLTWIWKLIWRRHFYHNCNHIAHFKFHFLLQQLSTFFDKSIALVCDAFFKTNWVYQLIVRNCNAKPDWGGISDLLERFVCIFKYLKLKIISALNYWSLKYRSAVPKKPLNDIFIWNFDIFWVLN